MESQWLLAKSNCMNNCIYMGVFAFIDERHMVSHLGVIIKDNIVYEGSMSGGYKSGCINGKPIFFHRLVGRYFVPNPQNKATINHKRGIKTDIALLNWNGLHIQKTTLMLWHLG